MDARYKFTGKEHDDEGGLDWTYFGARYYDPEVGRWFVTDPADEFFTPYTYAGNSPMMYVDPTGASVDPAGGFGGGRNPGGFSIYPTPEGFGIGIPIWGNLGVTDMFPPFLGFENGGEPEPEDCPEGENCLKFVITSSNFGLGSKSYEEQWAELLLGDFGEATAESTTPSSMRGQSSGNPYIYSTRFPLGTTLEQALNLRQNGVIRVPVPAYIGGTPGDFGKFQIGVVPGRLLTGLLSGARKLSQLRIAKWGQRSDWIRFGTTIVPPQIVGKDATKPVLTWAIKGGGKNPQTGFNLPFHYHIHKYNWYRPWLWFKYTPM